MASRKVMRGMLLARSYRQLRKPPKSAARSPHRSVSCLRERHFEVDLGELGLAVGAQIFIAETADNLKVALVSADHQQLFKDLRRLRQGIEVAGLDAAGNQIIARAFGRGARHKRRFDFKEALGVQRLPDSERNFRAHDDVALHAGPAQIDVAVLQAHVFFDVDVVFERKWRRARFVQNPDLRDGEFHFAGRDGRVDGLGGCGP